MKKVVKILKNKTARRLFTTAVSLVVLVFATIAWFVSQQNVGGQGMNVEFGYDTDLIVGDSPETIEEDVKYELVFTDEELKLKPATHAWELYGVNTETGLITNINSDIVSIYTGFALDGQTLLYKAVPVADSADTIKYYKDYTIYISSSIGDTVVKSLSATFNASSSLGTISDYMYAASVDFYDDTVSKDNYLGTLAIADTLKTPQKSVDLMNGKTKMTIPYNKTEGINYKRYVMRFYFDGALEKSSGQAYVYAHDLSTADFDMWINVEGEDYIESE